MRIALAGARVRHNDTAFNLAQIRLYMEKAKAAGAELVCFGEAFLQGFSAFSWRYETDRAIAVSVQDELFRQLLAQTSTSGPDLLFGFLERDGNQLYSSCALLGGGKLLRLYRRVSTGWKEFTLTDDHYREGTDITPFVYRGRKCLIALCGDLWDTTASCFHKGQEITFWPLYINFTREEWYGEENERMQYAQKAAEFSRDVLMINSYDDHPSNEPPALGGCCWFCGGEIRAEQPLGCEGLLIADL